MLLIAGTVCFTVLSSGATIVIIELVHPSTDTTDGLRTITGIINTLIGLLAGFLAGKTGSTIAQDEERIRQYEEDERQRGSEEDPPP